MPIQSKKPISLPAGNDNIAYGMQICPSFSANGVTGSLSLTTQHYRAESDGSGPVKIGDSKTIFIADVFAEAEKDAALAALVTQFQELVSTYVASKSM